MGALIPVVVEAKREGEGAVGGSERKKGWGRALPPPPPPPPTEEAEEEAEAEEGMVNPGCSPENSIE